MEDNNQRKALCDLTYLLASEKIGYLSQILNELYKDGKLILPDP